MFNETGCRFLFLRHAVDWIQEENKLRVLSKCGKIMFTLNIPKNYPNSRDITLDNACGLDNFSEAEVRTFYCCSSGGLFFYLSSLSKLPLAFLKPDSCCWGIRKQCRPNSDTTACRHFHSTQPFITALLLLVA